MFRMLGFITGLYKKDDVDDEEVTLTPRLVKSSFAFSY